MLTIGITGRLGSGKSAAARILEKLGGKVISADDLGREVVEDRPHILSKLIRAFGTEIVTPEGNLKRRELARLAFSSPQNLENLNKIVHPALLQRLEEELERCRHDPDCALIVVDAALLVDWGLHAKMDYVICVSAEEKIQIARQVEKGLSPEEARMRLKSQKPQEELGAVSDFVIENNGTLEELETKIRQVYDQILSREGLPPPVNEN